MNPQPFISNLLPLFKNQILFPADHGVRFIVAIVTLIEVAFAFLRYEELLKDLGGAPFVILLLNAFCLFVELMIMHRYI